MKSIFLPFVFFLTSIGLTAQLDWLGVASSADRATKERFLGVCTGPAGEVYAAGSFATNSTPQPYLHRFSSLGTPGYNRTLGTGSGTAYDAAFDDFNNRLVVAGNHQGQPYLELIDPATGATHSVSPIAGGGVIKAIDVTPNFIYAIGNYSGTLDFGAPVALSITGGGAFVAQFDLNGNIQQIINVPGGAKGFDVKTDAAGNIYFTLTTTADITFGTGFPGNYTFSGPGQEDQILVQANSAMVAQWSTMLRNSNFPLSVEAELPVALDEGLGLIYAATPYEPNTGPTIDGGIGSFQMVTGTFNQYVAVPDREVRDLTVNCGELFAVGGRVQSFGRTTCGNANHVAWYQSFGSTLTPAALSSATTCSWAGAVTADDFGNVLVAGGFLEAPSLTWDGLTQPSLQRGGGMVAHLPTGQQCCTRSQDICLRFDGIDDHLSFTNSPLQGRTEFTIETWFRSEDMSSPANFRSLFFNGGTGFGFGVLSGNLALRGGGSTQPIAPIVNDRWYHLAVVFDNGNLTTYLDCRRVDRQGGISPSLASNFFLGQVGSSPGIENWQGRIDEFSVYGYARGPGEIIAGKDCRLTGSEDGLILYLPLDQGLPGQPNPGETIAFDQSASANNGTLNNFALNGQQSNWVCSPIILDPPCPPPPCAQPLPNNTFSLYQETRDVGSPAGVPELDVAYGAFRLASGEIIFGGVVDGSDSHNPLYFGKTDDQGNLIGNPNLYHPTIGNETIALLKDEPTPIRNAAGNIIGFLASQLYRTPGQPEQKVLLQLDLNLNIVSSRVYQSVITGVSEKFTDVIQDSFGDFIAIGQINKAQYNSGFVMRIKPNLTIADYELIEGQFQDIYPDQIIEAPISFPVAPGGTIASNYVIGGHFLNGTLFGQGIDFNLKPLAGAVTASEASSGSGANYLAGMARRSDGALVLIGSSKDGRIWANIFPDVSNILSYESYLIDIDNGLEEAYSVAPLAGDRLLIGGRAETLNSSNDDSQAALLEFDLNTATVNWVRTYGNTNYPESTLIDVYADDDGFLLSGYGITPAGIAAGGFGKLKHFDSWLAATDTLGRVFDCDCYEDSYATVTPLPVGFTGGILDFNSIVKGQDDLAQDLTKASVVNYFCDQYQAPVSPVCCGGEDEDRMRLVGATSITENGQAWVVNNDSLPDCFTLRIDWGDGIIDMVSAGQLPSRHTYVADDDYDICITYQALADDGTVCWEETQCRTVVGADEVRSVADLTVYPNPTDGMIFLRFPGRHGQPSVRVFTVAGQPVRNLPKTKDNTLSLAGLPSGMYVLDLRFPDGAAARRKVMVR